MACEEYSILIKEEAFSGLNSERGNALREHLAQCVSCRNEFDHAKNIAKLLDSGVKMLVAGEPSPQFAARLRARIAEEPVQATFEWRAWIPVAASAFVLALLLVAVTIRTPRSGDRNVTTMAQIPRHSEVVVPARTESSAAEGGLMAPRSTHRTVQPRQHEVLVPPGQLAAVMQLAKALNSAHVEIEQTSHIDEQSEKSLEIEALHISPLIISKLDDVGSGMSGGL